MSLTKTVFAGFVLIASSGCATIIGHQNQLVSLNSKPPGASVEIKNREGESVFKGTTPTTVILAKSNGRYFGGEKYTVKFSMPECGQSTVYLVTRVNGWYFANIIFGGVVGMILVDPLNGGMYNLDPGKVNAILVPSADAEKQNPLCAVNLAGKSGAEIDHGNLPRFTSDGLPVFLNTPPVNWEFVYSSASGEIWVQKSSKRLITFRGSLGLAAKFAFIQRQNDSTTSQQSAFQVFDVASSCTGNTSKLLSVSTLNAYGDTLSTDKTGNETALMEKSFAGIFSPESPVYGHIADFCTDLTGL